MTFTHYIGVQIPEGVGLRPKNDLPDDRSKFGALGKWFNFERFADKNTYICEGAEIGKEYDKREVEGPVWQYYTKTEEWKDVKAVFGSIKSGVDFYKNGNINLRQIYRLKPAKEEEYAIGQKVLLKKGAWGSTPKGMAKSINEVYDSLGIDYSNEYSYKINHETAEQAAERLNPYRRSMSDKGQDAETNWDEGWGAALDWMQKKQ